MQYRTAQEPYIDYVKRTVAKYARNKASSLETVQALTQGIDKKTHSPHKETRRAYRSRLESAFLRNESYEPTYHLLNVASLLPIRTGTENQLARFIEKAVAAGKQHKLRAINVLEYDEYVAEVQRDGIEVLDNRTKCIIVRGMEPDVEKYLEGELENDPDLLDNITIIEMDDTFHKAMLGVK